MHIHLRERDVQTFHCESLVDLLVHTEKGRPIVGRINPHAHGDVDRTVVELAQLDERLRRF